MPHIVTDACIGHLDRSCVEVCPVNAIHPTADDVAHYTAEQVFIDPVDCIDCGACAPACPVEAISFDEDLPPEQRAQASAAAADYYARRLDPPVAGR